MARLNKDRQDKLEPLRLKSCKKKLEELGYEVEEKGKRLEFAYKGHIVLFWAYSGWHTGKSIKDGRGFGNLLRQL